jgi:hypothetical protein
MPVPPRRPLPGPGALPLARAIDASTSLAGLLARVRESEARLAAIRPVLPEGLGEALRAGPLDDQAWTLLADHASAAAKLRHCLPRIEAALVAAGWPGPGVKVKVRPRA